MHTVEPLAWYGALIGLFIAIALILKKLILFIHCSSVPFSVL